MPGAASTPGFRPGAIVAGTARCASPTSVATASPAATVAVLVVAVDQCSELDELLGEGSGAAVASVVGDRLRESVREEDSVVPEHGRFVVAVTNGAAGRAVCERLAERLGQPMAIGGRTVWLTVSIGAAVGSPATRPVLVGAARQALDTARRRGGDGWALAPGS